VDHRMPQDTISHVTPLGRIFSVPLIHRKRGHICRGLMGSSSLDQGDMAFVCLLTGSASLGPGYPPVWQAMQVLG
jgi:hypothetical protein